MSYCRPWKNEYLGVVGPVQLEDLLNGMADIGQGGDIPFLVTFNKCGSLSRYLGFFGDFENEFDSGFV